MLLQKLPVQKLGYRHPNTRVLASSLVHSPLEYNMKMHIADIFYLFGDFPPSIFPLKFRYIYFLLYILPSQSSWQDHFQYLCYQKKRIISFPRNIFVIIPISFEFLVHFSQTEISFLTVPILLLQNQEHLLKIQV